MRSILALFVALAGPPAVAQAPIALTGEVEGNTVLVRGFDDRGPQPVFQATWRFTDEGVVFDLQRTAEPDGSRSLMLDRLVEAGLGAYLDAHVRFQKQGVIADEEPDRLLNLMNAMAWTAEERFGVSGSFAGFESPTRDQLIRLVHIDWSQARFAVVDDEQDKYLAIYFYVRSQRQELERQMRADLLALAHLDVLRPEERTLSAGQRERINSVCGTVFDQNNFLCALDLSVSDSSMALPEAHLGTAIERAMDEHPADPGQQPRLRKRDRWLKQEFDAINARIDRMDQRKELWEMRDRLDDLQGQIDDLRLSVEDLGTARPQPEEANPIAALSELTGRNVTIRFARYRTDPDPEYLLALNEVFEQLARSPQDRVLITGYTDRSGDAATNLRLSEQRAKAVRNYLLQRGIAPERLLVNYYGDSRSAGRDPRERRVEIEWLR